MKARAPALILYQNDNTGTIVTHKQRYRPSDPELRVLIAELQRDTGLLAVWIDIDDAQWFEFHGTGIFRDQDMQGSQVRCPRHGAPTVDPEEIVSAYRAIRQDS